MGTFAIVDSVSLCEVNSICGLVLAKSRG